MKYKIENGYKVYYVNALSVEQHSMNFLKGHSGKIILRFCGVTPSGKLLVQSEYYIEKLKNKWWGYHIHRENGPAYIVYHSNKKIAFCAWYMHGVELSGIKSLKPRKETIEKAKRKVNLQLLQNASI